MDLQLRLRADRLRWLVLRGVGVAISLAVTGAWAQAQTSGQHSSLSDLDIEFTEAQLTLGSVVEENRGLREQLTSARQSIGQLSESLAISNAEAEVFRRQFAEARLQLEALGLDAIGTDRSKLEQRLLTAIADLQVAMDERESLAGAVLLLNDLLEMHFSKAEDVDPELRMEIESTLRAANAVLGVMPLGVADATATAASITDAIIISLRDDLSLVVANVGANQGVKIGMPFGIWRDDRQIGVARVVDVREKISGAVIQSLADEATRLRVGDRLRVDAR